MLFFAKSRELVDCCESSICLPAQLSGRDIHAHIISLYPRFVVFLFACIVKIFL